MTILTLTLLPFAFTGVVLLYAGLRGRTVSDRALAFLLLVCVGCLGAAIGKSL
jgi:hypothetical protein